MIEGTAVAPPKDTTRLKNILLQAEKESAGNKVLETKRVAGTLLGNTAQEVTQRAANMKPEQQEGMKNGEKALMQASWYATSDESSFSKLCPKGYNPNEGNSGGNEIRVSVSTPALDGSGDVSITWRVRKIISVNGDSFICELDNPDQPGYAIKKSEPISRAQLVEAQLVTEADAIADLYKGADREVVAARLKGKEASDGSIKEVAKSLGLMRVEDVKENIANSAVLKEQPIPADMPDGEEKTALLKKNAEAKAAKANVEAVLAKMKDKNLVDIAEAVEIMKAQGGKDFDPAAMATDSRKQINLLQKAIKAGIGAPHPENPNRAVTQADIDSWKENIDTLRAVEKVYTEMANGTANSLLEAYFRNVEAGIIPPTVAAKVMEAFRQGNIESMVDTVGGYYSEHVDKGKDANTITRQKAERKKRWMEIAGSAAMRGGGMMAMLVLFGMLQGMKGGQ